MNVFRLIQIATACFVVGMPTHAAVLNTYTDRAAFNAAVGGPLTLEDFESFTEDTSFNGTALDIGEFTISTSIATANPNINIIDVPPLFRDNFNGTTGAYFFLDNSTATLEFDDPIHALGFDQYGFGNGVGVSKLTILDETFLDDLLGNERTFFGVVSDTPFTTAVFSSVTNDGFFLDNLAYGRIESSVVVPLPAALPLLLAGLGGLALVGRRRRGC